MAVVLTPDMRKAVSRRLVKLPGEIVALTNTSDNLDDAGTAYGKVDESNSEFLQNWLNIANMYLDEKQNINGEEYDTYNQGVGDDFDIDRVFITNPTLNVFFPVSHATLSDNYFLNPQINIYTNSAANGVISATYESRVSKDYEMLALTLLTGLTGGVNTTVAVTYSGGNTLQVANGAGTSNDSCVIVDGDNGAVVPSQYLFYIASGGGTNTLTGWAISGGPGNVVPAGSQVVVGGGVVWSDAARDSLSGAAPFVILSNNIVTYMNNTAIWSGHLTAEDVALTANDDARAPQQAQNTAALAAIPIIEAATTTWLTFPVSDVGGNSRYNDPALTAFQTPVDVRSAFVVTRLAQIVVALGAVAYIGGGPTFTATGAAGNKYRWADRRCNKNYGSLSQEDNAESTKEIIDEQKQNSEDLLIDYEAVMTAAALNVEPTGSKTVYITDVSGFSVGDSIYAIDELNLELNGFVTGVYVDINRMDLSFDFPSTYTLDYLARVYKLL